MNEFIKQLKEKAMKINNLIENSTAIAQERQKYGYDEINSVQNRRFC